jgi:hypothetical protein
MIIAIIFRGDFGWSSLRSDIGGGLVNSLDCPAFGRFSFHFLSLAQASLARPKNENCRFAAAVKRVAETEGFEPFTSWFHSVHIGSHYKLNYNIIH